MTHLKRSGNLKQILKVAKRILKIIIEEQISNVSTAKTQLKTITNVL